jgi:arylsulfatase A-like enzyme
MQKRINIFIIMLWLSLAACTRMNEKKTRKEILPNIVFIFTDDLGYGDLGCFGAKDIKTPNIDALAEQGIRFTSFYSASPVCSPSRAALMTGKMPQRMGINSVFFPESFTGMPGNEMTVAEMLKEKDYATAIVGKWHLGHLHQFLPLQQGFDEYFGIPYSNDMESVVYMRGNEVEEYQVDQHYTTRRYTEEAMQFIERNKKLSFFLYLAHNMPHVPIYASEGFAGTSGRGLYGDVIQEIDWSVGQIVNKLKELDLLENTIIIFSSDNGPWLAMEDHGGSAGELREGKQYTFEGGMRVPTVAMWKAKIPAGTVYDGIACQMDWFPTFAALAGIRLDESHTTDGVDISNVLFGQGIRSDSTFMYFDLAELQCYRRGDWKVKLPYAGFEGARWKKAVAAHDTLLFNLRKDPGEKENLHTYYPEKSRELIREMNRRYKDMQPLPSSLVIKTPADESHYIYLESRRKKKP